MTIENSTGVGFDTPKDDTRARAAAKLARARGMIQASGLISQAADLLGDEREHSEESSLTQIYHDLRPRALAVMRDAMELGLPEDDLVWITEAIEARIDREKTTP